MEPEHHQLEDLRMHNAHACSPQEKWPNYVWPANRGSAGSRQRGSVRENATNILTFVARSVRGSVFTTNRSPRGVM